ncbi:DUF1513 domain-containing protein [Alphaproteobacteria bacterium KMM 3653]|uniref:DUF1513 domain-containing protein n=1 Tax=Harenicola maris TaxID=2841044 RepID=A0AAP2CSM8_9RHOB|nr:DUF1513 domain-containing protein [Harenicola maris]
MRGPKNGQIKTDRRGFLTGLLAASLAPRLTWADAGDPAYLAAAREADGTFALFGLSLNGTDLFRIPLPARGHAAAAHPTRPEAVAFARRPGTYALVINCVDGNVMHRLTAPKGRHFYGHGTFIDDDTLCCTENDVATGEGRISLWSRSAGYARIGDIPSGGIGPHDIKLMPDGKTLVVANGGILTHPDTGREKLNLDTMRPNLSYVDPASGPVETITLPPELHQNSIRHLDLRADGLVAFAMQWEGELGAPVPLLGLHIRGPNPIDAEPILAEPAPADLAALKGYAGSVSFDGTGKRIAITSPVGGKMLVHDLEGGDWLWPRRDVCGVASSPSGFLVTDGLGGVFRIIGEQAENLALANRAWDNHLVKIG